MTALSLLCSRGERERRAPSRASVVFVPDKSAKVETCVSEINDNVWKLLPRLKPWQIESTVSWCLPNKLVAVLVVLGVYG